MRDGSRARRLANTALRRGVQRRETPRAVPAAGPRPCNQGRRARPSRGIVVCRRGEPCASAWKRARLWLDRRAGRNPTKIVISRSVAVSHSQPAIYRAAWYGAHRERHPRRHRGVRRGALTENRRKKDGTQAMLKPPRAAAVLLRTVKKDGPQPHARRREAQRLLRKPDLPPRTPQGRAAGTAERDWRLEVVLATCVAIALGLAIFRDAYIGWAELERAGVSFWPMAARVLGEEGRTSHKRGHRKVPRLGRCTSPRRPPRHRSN